MSCRRAAERVYPYRSKSSQSDASAAGTAVRDVTVMSAVRAVTSLTSGSALPSKWGFDDTTETHV